MPRWNGKIETGGTAPPLQDDRRRPIAVRERLEALAKEYGCKLVDVTWQPGSWVADVTFEDADGARKLLEKLEAADVREVLSAEEKEEEQQGKS